MENWWNQNIVNPVRRTVGLPGYSNTNTASFQQDYLGDPYGVVGANAADANRAYREKKAVARAPYDQLMAAVRANPQGYSPQQLASFIGNNYGSAVGAQEYLGALEQIYGSGQNWDSLSATTTGTFGTGGTPQVTTDLSGKIQALNDMYGVIYNDLANLTKEKRASLESDYGDQTKNLQTTYERVAAQLPLQYGAQGIGQSSYYAKAAGGAQDEYNQQNQAIQKAQTKSMADLGQFYQSALGQYQGQQAGLAGYGGTGTQADAAALDTQLNQLGQARAGLQTQGQNIAGLNAIAPTQNTGAAQLQKILGELAVSSIPDFAKQDIAKTQIQKSGQDQAFYTDYFDKLRQQTPVA